MISPRRTVLVTGAGRGIGLACVQDLDRHGFRVFAGVRRPQDADGVRAATDGRAVPVSLDITDATQVTAAAGLLQEETGDIGLWGLVNNAGAVYAGPMEHLPVPALRDQLEVNVVGTVALTQACLPALRRAQGRIVNVSSVNGRIVSPFSGAYAASKFALEAVSDALRRELAGAGVRVIVIQPGAVETPIWEVSRDRALALAETWPPEAHAHYPWLVRAFRNTRVPPRAAPPSRVAAAIRRALTARRPRSRYRVGWDARLGVLAAWLLPDGSLDAVLNRRQRR
jgi:NAD(P)-dependent dehydrogenase (short-subunit alcohol dehydrogenase family)